MSDDSDPTIGYDDRLAWQVAREVFIERVGNTSVHIAVALRQIEVEDLATDVVRRYLAQRKALLELYDTAPDAFEEETDDVPDER